MADPNDLGVEERPAQPTGQLVIRDREGCISVKAVQAYFEGSVRSTEALCKQFPLNRNVMGDEFIEYVSFKTQAAWIGFAIGMRCLQRVAKAQTATDGVNASEGGQQ
jgi:hypothetical protein